MERHGEQSSANGPNVRQVWGRNQAGDEHRNTGGQEVESDGGILLQVKQEITNQ